MRTLSNENPKCSWTWVQLTMNIPVPCLFWPRMTSWDDPTLHQQEQSCWETFQTYNPNFFNLRIIWRPWITGVQLCHVFRHVVGPLHDLGSDANQEGIRRPSANDHNLGRWMIGQEECHCCSWADGFTSNVSLILQNHNHCLCVDWCFTLLLAMRKRRSCQAFILMLSHAIYRTLWNKWASVLAAACRFLVETRSAKKQKGMIVSSEDLLVGLAISDEWACLETSNPLTAW